MGHPLGNSASCSGNPATSFAYVASSVAFLLAEKSAGLTRAAGDDKPVIDKVDAAAANDGSAQGAADGGIKKDASVTITATSISLDITYVAYWCGPLG